VLADTWWPGPLTLVLPVRGGLTGFRIPDHPVPLGILERVNGILAVTSANLSGGEDPVTADQAAADLGDRVELVLDGGSCAGGVPSTVVKVVNGDVEILREGAIAEADIIRATE
jgi:L-threonylcarbamoyladenylate synthase